MPVDVVSNQVRVHVHDLRGRVAPRVAEDVALAMVKGAADAFLDMAGEDDLGRSPERRLLDVLPFDVAGAVRRSLS